MFEFQKALGYHKQMRSDAYTVPKGLKGKLTTYTLAIEGTEPIEVVFMPVPKAYQVNLKLDWQQQPVIVVHNGEAGGGRWQADDFQTGLMIVGYFNTRAAAAAAVLAELTEKGEKEYWTAQKALVKSFKAAKAPINVLQLPPRAIGS